MAEANGIVVLPSTEAVRKRPSMYVGDLNDGTGLKRLIWEVLLNVLDQHLLGYAHKVRIELFGDGTIEVEDDGPGISLETKRYGIKRLLDAMLVDLCNGPISGLVSTSALSAFFEMETTCRGERARVRTERGLLTEPAHSLGTSTQRGTVVRFRPDEAIFGFGPTPAFLAPSIEAFAWMYPQLAITWQGKVIAAHGGFPAWTRSRAESPPRPSRAQRGLEDDFVFSVRAPQGEHFVDLAVGWERADTRPGVSDSAGLLSFVNFQCTHDGTHIPGVLEGLSAVAHAWGQPCSRDAFASRLIGAVHVVESHPWFHKPTRSLGVTPLAKQLVSEVVQAQLPAALECHPLAKARFLARARGK